MTPRLCVEPLTEPGQRIELDREQSHYALRVLRLRSGEAVQLFDGQGARWQATLTEVTRDRASVVLEQALPAMLPSPLAITLVQCVSSAEHMDFTIEKAAELGVAAIVPVMASRGLVKLDEARGQKRLAHWKKLLVAACRQCGEDTLPRLTDPVPLTQWLTQRPPTRTGWVLSPTGANSLARLAAGCTSPQVDLLVGPESGLSDAEVAQAETAGLRSARLGPRVLRTETAGLAAIAVLQSAMGDLV